MILHLLEITQAQTLFYWQQQVSSISLLKLKPNQTYS